MSGRSKNTGDAALDRPSTTRSELYDLKAGKWEMGRTFRRHQTAKNKSNRACQWHWYSEDEEELRTRLEYVDDCYAMQRPARLSKQQIANVQEGTRPHVHKQCTNALLRAM